MIAPVIQTSSILPPQSRASEFGANWRLQFLQPDGLPLTMSSFEQIDFGSISYKEIFQNVKTILATPLFSAALERTLGVDQTIVDRPISDASHVTIAILTAVAQWEPRAVIMNIDFEADAINGHLIVKLQLDIRNVIYGTNTVYPATDIGQPSPEDVVQSLPPTIDQPVYVEGPAGPPGPIGEQGPPGQRGSLWFTGTGAPDIPEALPQDMYLDKSTGDVSQLQSPPPQKGKQGPPGSIGPQGPMGSKGTRASMWFFGKTDPVDVPNAQSLDLYLNTSNGDVWQLQGSPATWRQVSHARNVDRDR